MNNGYGKPITPPDGYVNVFSDEFKKALNTKAWRYGQSWGEFHPNEPHQYYDNNGTLSYVSSEGLVLELRKYPKTFLKKKKLFFTGIDVIGNYLTEINVTSPTGIQEINRLNGVRLEKFFWDRVEKKLR
mgnify:CR=1 FL=1